MDASHKVSGQNFSIIMHLQYFIAIYHLQYWIKKIISFRLKNFNLHSAVTGSCGCRASSLCAMNHEQKIGKKSEIYFEIICKCQSWKKQEVEKVPSLRSHKDHIKVQYFLCVRSSRVSIGGLVVGCDIVFHFFSSNIVLQQD